MSDTLKSILSLIKEHPIVSALAAFASYKLLEHTFSFSLWFGRTFCRQSYNLLERYGKCWAAVTGATGGIGEAYCELLAKIGFNLLLIGRDEVKLKELQTLLSKKFKSVETQILAADFDKQNYQEWSPKFLEKAQTLDIGLLIFAAGAGHGAEYHLYPYDKMQQLINVSVINYTMLCWMLVPKMLKRKERSGILAISSGSSIGYYPILCLYSATRAFMDAFGKALDEELHEDKIDVTTIQCGPVFTKMYPHKTPFTLMPYEAAQTQIRHLGKQSLLAGCFKHDMFLYYWKHCDVMGRAAFLKSYNAHWIEEWKKAK